MHHNSTNPLFNLDAHKNAAAIQRQKRTVGKPYGFIGVVCLLLLYVMLIK